MGKVAVAWNLRRAKLWGPHGTDEKWQSTKQGPKERQIRGREFSKHEFSWINILLTGIIAIKLVLSIKYIYNKIVDYEEIIKIVKTDRKEKVRQVLICTLDCSESHYVAQSGLGCTVCPQVPHFSILSAGLHLWATIFYMWQKVLELLWMQSTWNLPSLHIVKTDFCDMFTNALPSSMMGQLTDSKGCFVH